MIKKNRNKYIFALAQTFYEMLVISFLIRLVSVAEKSNNHMNLINLLIVYIFIMSKNLLKIALYD